MMPNIRQMTAADKPVIMQLLKRIPEFEPEEIVIAEEVIDCFLRDPVGSGYPTLVAEIGLATVGYICYGPAPLTRGTWDIYWMAVEPKEQAKGIGKALMAAAESDITEHQARLIVIETSSKPEYEKTRRFHIARGYELVCRIADFYSPGDDKLIFQKRLG